MFHNLTVFIKRNILFLTLVAIVLLYYKMIYLNFVTEDYHQLWTGKFNSLNEFNSFFFYKDTIEKQLPFYRPLTTQVYYGLMQKAFGIEAFYFHLASLVFHLFNTYLVYKIATHFLKSTERKFSFLASVIYGLNPSHVVNIIWPAVFQEVGSTFSLSLSLLTFVYSISRKNNLLYILSLLFFSFSLLSKEVAIMFPFLLVLYIFVFNKKSYFKRLLPFFLLLAYYSYFHFIKYPFQQTEGYTFLVNFQALNTLRWHVWWALGFPEPMTTYIGDNTTIQPQLWYSFTKETIVVFSLFIVLCISVAFGVYKIMRIKFTELIDKRIFFFATLYLFFLVPILFLPENKNAYHQTFSLVGFSLVLSLFFIKLQKIPTFDTKFLAGVFISSLLCLYFYSAYFTYNNNRISTRSYMAEILLATFRTQNPNVQENSIIVVKNDRSSTWGSSSKQAYYTLGEWAFKLYYGDSIEVYFEDIDTIPKDIDQSRLVEYYARHSL